MKRAIPVILALAAGCSSGPSEEPERAPEPARPAPRPANPKEAEISSIRASLAVKKADLAQADADLARLAAEKETEKEPTRLASIGTLESEAKRKKEALGLDIAELEAKLKDLSAGSKQSDDPLAAALEEDAAAEREKAANRKAKEEAERSAEARKVAEAEATRRVEAEAKSKEKVGSAGAAPTDGTLYEERFAAVILKVREALQQFKRW